MGPTALLSLALWSPRRLTETPAVRAHPGTRSACSEPRAVSSTDEQGRFGGPTGSDIKTNVPRYSTRARTRSPLDPDAKPRAWPAAGPASPCVALGSELALTTALRGRQRRSLHSQVPVTDLVPREVS